MLETIKQKKSIINLFCIFLGIMLFLRAFSIIPLISEEDLYRFGLHPDNLLAQSAFGAVILFYIAGAMFIFYVLVIISIIFLEPLIKKSVYLSKLFPRLGTGYMVEQIETAGKKCYNRYSDIIIIQLGILCVAFFGTLLVLTAANLIGFNQCSLKKYSTGGYLETCTVNNMFLIVSAYFLAKGLVPEKTLKYIGSIILWEKKKSKS